MRRIKNMKWPRLIRALWHARNKYRPGTEDERNKHEEWVSGLLWSIISVLFDTVFVFITIGIVIFLFLWLFTGTFYWSIVPSSIPFGIVVGLYIHRYLDMCANEKKEK